MCVSEYLSQNVSVRMCECEYVSQNVCVSASMWVSE